jgi:tetratricopeptide (TPR) repeat protein
VKRSAALFALAAIAWHIADPAAQGPSDPRAVGLRAVTDALRAGEFFRARDESQVLLQLDPQNADSLALHGDALWSAGLFDAAEASYRDALAQAPALPRGHHGLARTLMGRGEVDEALAEGQTARSLAPDDPEVRQTIGEIYERMWRYEQAAQSYSEYVGLLPNNTRTLTALRARAEVKFLRSFGTRTPVEIVGDTGQAPYIVPFRIVNDKILVRVRVNGGSPQDFVVDTGAEKTVVSGITANRAHIVPITYTPSAGVGDDGIVDLELGRIDSLQIGGVKIRNVPCLIKDRLAGGVPRRVADRFSPLALGFSMIVDYQRHHLILAKHLPPEPADVELPLRLNRLATVQGVVDETHAISFVVDTGGEVISISQATARSLDRPAAGRKIRLKVFGSSGWDREAFLLPNTNLKFGPIQYKRAAVAVLNLRMPSALLGFQLGGILGHQFLSNYRVSIDLERSVLRLKKS